MPRWNSYLLRWAAFMPDCFIGAPWAEGYAKNGVPSPLTVRLGYAKKWRTHLRVRQTALSSNAHAG